MTPIRKPDRSLFGPANLSRGEASIGFSSGKLSNVS